MSDLLSFDLSDVLLLKASALHQLIER